MAEQSQADRAAKFEQYNPYAERAAFALTSEFDGDRAEAPTMAALAMAYEMGRLRNELHFARKGGQA
jgi:hypothetical protein